MIPKVAYPQCLAEYATIGLHLLLLPYLNFCDRPLSFEQVEWL